LAESYGLFPTIIRLLRRHAAWMSVLEKIIAERLPGILCPEKRGTNLRI
jgi:hypothetical protein